MISPHLAQISQDQLGPIVPWLVGLSAVLFLANQALTFYNDHMREKPTPSDTYATKKEMTDAHGRMSREKKERDAELDLMREEIAAIRLQVANNHQAGEDRAAKIHDRINLLLEDNADLPLRVVELLKATKGLIG
jgi:hypothetical protein